MRSLLKFIAILGLLSNCALTENPSAPVGYLAPIQNEPLVTIKAASDANNRSAIAVDVVYTNSPQLINLLSTLSAREYFRQRQQILRDHTNMVMIYNWEIPPGYQKQQKITGLQGPIESAFVFADYNIPGTHRARAPATQNLSIQLDRTDFKVLPI